MKKIVLFLLVSCALLSTSYTTKDSCYIQGNAAARYYGLKGKVKTITEYSGTSTAYNEETKTWKKSGDDYDCIMKISFSEKGEDQETVIKFKDGRMLAHHVNLYDKNCYLGFKQVDSTNQLLEKSILDQSSATDYYYYFQVYDEKGVKIKSMATQMDTLTGAITIEIKSITGEVLFTQRREMTNEHLIKADIICNRQTENCFTLNYEYIKFDSQGNWIERLDRNSEVDEMTLTERKIEYYK